MLEQAEHYLIANDTQLIGFDKATGRLAVVRNLLTGWNYLLPGSDRGNPFLVFYDFHDDYHLIPNGEDASGFGIDPGSISGNVFHAYSAQVSDVILSTNSITLTTRSSDKRWQCRLQVAFGETNESSLWDLEITNITDTAAAMMPVFPFIDGLQVGGKDTSKMVVNIHGGFVRPLWSEKGGIYGNCGQMTMQWGCAFDEDQGNAWAFMIEDEIPLNKDIRYDEPSVQVRYFPIRTIGPGETIRMPRVRMMVYKGDWKPAAVAYSRWIEKAFTGVPHAEWVKNLHGHVGQWVEKQEQQITRGMADPLAKGLRNPMESFVHIPDVYRRKTVDCIEWCFHCRRSMDPQITGKSHIHTDGDNIIREDLGGAEAFRQAVEEVHKLGHRATLYVEGYLCASDSDIVLNGGGANWTVMNVDGTNAGYYTKQGSWVHMCPGAEGWQDHLATTAARLVRETGVDGVRLDSLGCHFFPCYNPAHNHKDPFDYNLWVGRLIEKVSNAVRRENPDCILTTEGPVDFYSKWADGALAQQWNDDQIAISRDVAPMRVAVPNYYVIAHNPCGPVAASLMGYPGGCGGMELDQAMLGLDEKWRSVLYTIWDVFRWGDAANDNPQASIPDARCRLFRGDQTDLVVGVRPLFRDDMDRFDPSLYGLIKNTSVGIVDDVCEYTVKVLHFDRTPVAAYIYDVPTLSLKKVPFNCDDEYSVVTLNSSWFALLLDYGENKPIITLDAPSQLHPGETASIGIHLTTPTPDPATPIGIYAPGLGLNTRVPVTGTDSIPISIPAHTPPGKYSITATNKIMRGCRRFITIQ